jgi:isoleucyl-tRNA synthetase
MASNQVPQLNFAQKFEVPKTDEQMFDFWQEQEIFLVFTAFTATLYPGPYQ